MTLRKRGVRAVLPLLAAVVLSGASYAITQGRRDAGRRTYTDFGRTVTPTEPAHLARLAPASAAPVKEFRIPVVHRKTVIADGVQYESWTFGGTVPGPVIRVREGDLVRVRFVNEGPIPHSIDFHSQRTAMDLAMRDIPPGDSLSFEFEAKDPGAFMVHCTTQPVALHVMQGMYLPMIVDPKGGWGAEVDAEFVLVQSEFYTREGTPSGVNGADWAAALQKSASHVVFNGRAFQYRAAPLRVRLGDRVRLFVINAGPNFVSNFHIVGAVFDRVYPGGRPDQGIDVVQTWPIPAGGSAVFETVFDEAGGEGMYAFVTHSFTDAFKGATGHFQVVGPPQVAARR
jgi:nitrite reductase (NO-forming)